MILIAIILINVLCVAVVALAWWRDRRDRQERLDEIHGRLYYLQHATAWRELTWEEEDERRGLLRQLEELEP